MKAVALYVTSKPQNRGMNETQVATHFRVAYRLENFKTTNVYAATTNWATQNGFSLYRNDAI